MSVRMKDIARDLGVSLMTVSKALRNHEDIADETRRRVHQRARELKYQPNLIARGLASRHSYLIGLVVPDMMHSFFAEVAKGAGDRLEPNGYQILISNSSERVDGLIIASATSSTGTLTEVLQTAHARLCSLIARSQASRLTTSAPTKRSVILRPRTSSVRDALASPTSADPRFLPASVG